MARPTVTGNLTTRVELHRPKPTAAGNSYNEIDLTSESSWQWVTDRWAEVKNAGVGIERMVADQVIASSNFLVKIRYDKLLTIDATWRLRPKGSTRNWNVVAVVNWEERNEWFYLTCTEPKP